MMTVAVVVLAAAVGPLVQVAAAYNCTPSVSIADAVEKWENQGPLQFTVTMTPPPPSCHFNGFVAVKTKPDPNLPEPVPGVDYEVTNSMIDWPAQNSATMFIEVPLIADKLGEAKETVQVCLYSPIGVDIVRECAFGTILSTPICVRPEEDQSAACRIPIDLPEAGHTPVTVDYSTVPGTATPGEDYRGITGGSLTIPAGDGTGLIAVEILPGRPVDPDEVFELDYRLTRDGVPESGRIPVMIVR